MVVASGEQVTAGLLAMTLQNMGVKARSFMGWQLVRATGVHGNARVDTVEAATLDEALSSGTVAVIPGFQGMSEDGRRGDARPRRVGHVARSRSPPGSRPTAATSTPTSTGSIPPTRGSCRGRASSARSRSRKCSSWPGVGAKVLQVRSVGLAMREKMPLRVLSAFEDVPGTEIVAELGE